MKYTITEKQDLNSQRDPLHVSEYASLKAAKIAARRLQFYQSTVLTIEEDGVLVSSYRNGEWREELGREETAP